MIQKLIAAFLYVDRLLNKLSGGHPRATISARCGYFSLHGKPYWVLMAAIINWTFRPIDGNNHCVKAYRWELGIMPMKDFERGNDFARLLLAHIILVGCPVIAIILRVAVLVESDIKHKDY